MAQYHRLAVVNILSFKSFVSESCPLFYILLFRTGFCFFELYSTYSYRIHTAQSDSYLNRNTTNSILLNVTTKSQSVTVTLKAFSENMLVLSLETERENLGKVIEARGGLTPTGGAPFTPGPQRPGVRQMVGWCGWGGEHLDCTITLLCRVEWGNLR